MTNSFLALIKKYGIYLGGIGGIISFQLIFFKLNNKNIAYFLSLLFYQLFLGIPFEGASLLILAYINALCINDRSIKKRRKINIKMRTPSAENFLKFAPFDIKKLTILSCLLFTAK